MQFIYQQRFWPQTATPAEFIREGILDVYVRVDPSTVLDNNSDQHQASDEADGGSGYVLGARLAMDYLDVNRAHLQSRSVHQICEDHSVIWGACCRALMDDSGDLHEHIVDGPEWANIAFMHNAVFHPALREWRTYIISSAAMLVPFKTLMATIPMIGGLDHDELFSLGFMPLHATPIAFKDSNMEGVYTFLEDDRDDDGIMLPATAREEVLRLWNERVICKEVVYLTEEAAEAGYPGYHVIR